MAVMIARFAERLKFIANKCVANTQKKIASTKIHMKYWLILNANFSVCVCVCARVAAAFYAQKRTR